MALFYSMEEKRRVELLAPAGNYESFLGAIHAGADAVYLGGEKFGARAYADNFTGEEICRAISYAHLFGRKVYLTVNTLLKDAEFPELIPYLEPFYYAGLDGVIVQDMGVLLAIREAFPGLALHASTQMTITGVYGARMLKELGACRIVPARELSLNEISHIKDGTGLEIEAFIHGAMCYCYSGQCLFSSILGGRSGNRGRCAQPCRLPYSLVQEEKAGKEQYLLSLKDMCTISNLPKLIDGGIDSFKIEGRMKKPEYAAGVTAIYRKYLDLYYEKGAEGYAVKEADLKKLSSLYIRSQMQEGYYFKRNGADMVTKTSPAYNGSDEQQFVSIRRQYIENTLKKNVRMQAVFRLGEAASLTMTCLEESREKDLAVSVTVTGEKVMQANKQPVTEENIRNGLAKLGNTPFSVEADGVEVNADAGIFYPLKAINELRRRAVEQLLAEYDPYGRQKNKGVREAIAEERQEESRRAAEKEAADIRGKEASLHVAVSTKEQLKAVLLAGIPVDILYLESDMLQLSAAFLRECREKAQTAGSPRFFIALPYILRKDGMEKLAAAYSLLEEADGVLVRNLEAYRWLAEQGYPKKLVTDAGLYCFNKKTLEFWEKQADGCCLAYELNGKESRQLLEGFGGQIEQIVYGRIPLMVTANCVAKTTGQCLKCVPEQKQERKEQEIFWLKDRYKKEFPVALCCCHCYNILYNSVPLSLHEKVQKGQVNGAMRLHFTTESGQETGGILRFFADCRMGMVSKPPYHEYTLGHEKRGVE